MEKKGKRKSLEINLKWKPCIKLTIMLSSHRPIFDSPWLIHIPCSNDIVLYYMAEKHTLEVPLLTAINSYAIKNNCGGNMLCLRTV